MSEPFLDRLEAHRGILYKIARAWTKSPGDREDLVQEIVIQLWRSFPRYDERFRFSTWMYRVALNVAISWHRREQTRASLILPGGEALLEVAEAPGGTEGSDPEDLAFLYRCIERLDDLDRALVLLYLDGRPHEEIAQVLGITATNVATKIGRLKDRLREDFRAAGQL